MYAVDLGNEKETHILNSEDEVGKLLVEEMDDAHEVASKVIKGEDVDVEPTVVKVTMSFEGKWKTEFIFPWVFLVRELSKKVEF